MCVLVCEHIESVCLQKNSNADLFEYNYFVKITETKRAMQTEEPDTIRDRGVCLCVCMLVCLHVSHVFSGTNLLALLQSVCSQRLSICVLREHWSPVSQSRVWTEKCRLEPSSLFIFTLSLVPHDDLQRQIIWALLEFGFSYECFYVKIPIF